MINIAPKALKSESNNPLPLLYRKAINTIEKHAVKKGVIKNGIIPFPQINHTLSTMFHLSKDDSVKVLDELKEAGVLEDVPYHGIKIVRKIV